MNPITLPSKTNPLVIFLVTVAGTVCAPVAWLYSINALLGQVQTIHHASNKETAYQHIHSAFVFFVVIGPCVAVLGGATAWAAMAENRSLPEEKHSWFVLICGALTSVLLLATIPGLLFTGWQDALPPPDSITAFENSIAIWTAAVFPAAWALFLVGWGWHGLRKQKRRLL